ncbi:MULTISPECIES: CoA-binding protein [unclassified Clostridioides]|uniref:CoA-binding protein n=1 Tax=unclassified Clostridioides TaxID=2635829 RepID=UPI001D0CA883|nr:CoA-binding protein [Clostridioides sp. ES-S-0001-02]MCC0639981.1 CoA-binding protein [Clostridioides sp. ES-S-0049-03]MCC0653739.1 CoA-binding protein [Clostridioides sp. ES-S-0001-03]MCC0655418.1 CoA-binding protein [Clostridioides sp. ES-S-0123-01]MCC0670741.1 CoA-binding protein [Clostridioides sp. ES-S-0145-01]MCC0674799.1 CoA-binding protein [Clostridioides sp. ES-W-0018-02]MCC0679327.1 CoA-binding protein [Clostridioides sp. ES-S-0005-03]MCC0696412.1 CoA-binding protein [Clostridio
MNLLKCDSWAVILNNSDEESKAYKILDELKKNMYKVVAIDEEKKNIEGIDVYECLKDVPHNIDVVAIIDKQSKMEAILEEIELLDIQNIWFEKGSFSEMIIKKIKDLKLNVEYNLSLYDELTK